MVKNSDEVKKKEVLAQLSEIGLSEKESEVYLALLPMREVGSSRLIEATGLHGQFVYDALRRLEDLGLAKHVTERGRKRFSPGNPLLLVSLIEGKRRTAEALAQSLQSRFTPTEEQDFFISQGKEAFAASEFEALERLPEGSY